MSSGFWYRTLVYLGLKEEPEEGYDDLPERGSHHDEEVRHNTGEYERFDTTGDPDVRHRRTEDDESNVRPLRSTDSPALRPLAGGRTRLAVLELTTFEDVEAVGARYRSGQPVVFDLQGADATTARRVVDFVSGLTYVSRGHMEKVGGRTFLLVPDGVELHDDERQRLVSLGLRAPSTTAD